jgi:hypothetical protein
MSAACRSRFIHKLAEGHRVVSFFCYRSFYMSDKLFSYEFRVVAAVSNRHTDVMFHRHPLVARRRSGIMVSCEPLR